MSHPLTLLSILVLFINDHVLRIYWPSWVTGKIGDFAWLYFAPFTLAIVLGCDKGNLGLGVVISRVANKPSGEQVVPELILADGVVKWQASRLAAIKPQNLRVVRGS